MAKTKLHFSGSDPSPGQRKSLNEAYRRVEEAAEGYSNDEEIEAMQDLIEGLMAYAGIRT